LSPYDLATYAVGLILLAVHGIPWATDRGFRLQESPSKLAMLLSGLLTIPHYLTVSLFPEESLIYPMYGDGINRLLPNFGILYSAGLVAMLIGIRLSNNKRITLNSQIFDIEINYYFISFISFVFYVISIYLILEKAGGWQSQISNFGQTAELQEGTGIFYIIKVPAAYLSILFLTVQYAKTGKPSLPLLVFVILIVVSIESLLGSRRTPIQLMVFAILAIMILKPNAKLFSVTNILFASISITIFYIILLWREQSYSNIEGYGIGKILVNMSYNDIYMFVMDHFSKNEFWFGKVFLDFQYRIVPLGPNLDPPSLDEGVYIYNLFLGRGVEPPLPLAFMAHNSWPPRTFGNGYMNFGIIGVIFFFMIQGYLTGKFYYIAKYYHFHAIPLFLYLLIIFSFQISNLKIAEIIIVLLGIVLVIAPIYLTTRLGKK
jgi:oligosaccharide repeat unit polymerase